MKRLFLTITVVLGLFLSINAQDFSYEEYCEKVTTEVDKFTGDTTHVSPYLRTQMYFCKLVKTDKVLTWVSVSVRSSTHSIGKGIYLLLDNGETISRPTKRVKASYSSGTYRNSSSIILTEDEIQLLKEHNITAVRLYIHDADIKKPEQYRGYINCIDNK